MSRWGVLVLSSIASCSRPDAQQHVVYETAPASASADVGRQDPARVVLRDADAGIAAFWPWWAGLDADARLKLATGQDPALMDALSQRVAAMHAALAWEFGPGRTSEHALTLSGEGDPVLRLVAERWRRAGPGDDPTWSYQTTRQAVARDELLGVTLRYEDVDLKLGETQLAVVRNERRPRLDLELWHPGFVRLSESSRGAAAFILLDQTLGEDATERWIGAMEVTSIPPAKPIDLLGLGDEVAKLVATTKENSHVVAEGKDPDTGQPLVFTLDVTIGRWDHPFHDTWCDVSLPYAANAQGMPNENDLATLYDLDDEIVALLGTDALRVGSATGAGHRHVWLYVDGDSEAVGKTQGWASKQTVKVEVATKFDPGWNELPL